MTYKEAVERIKTFNLENHMDWRIPTIKELYSLMLFSGVDVSSKEISKLPNLVDQGLVHACADNIYLAHFIYFGEADVVR